MSKYRLTVNEAQLRLINRAVEEYFRLGMLQLGDLAERLALLGVDFSGCEAEEKRRKVEAMLRRKDIINYILKSITTCLKEDGIPMTVKDIDCDNAIDIWHVIRHQFWLEDPNRRKWTTDASSPLQLGDYPLPKIEVVDD